MTATSQPFPSAFSTIRTGRTIDPFSLFEEWFAAAADGEPNDPHAMALATVDAAGLPDVRMVLMNARDHRGFVLLHQFREPQGRASCWPTPGPRWCSTGSRCAGRFGRGGRSRSSSRRRGRRLFRHPRRASRQLGAHASKQSRPLASRVALMEAVETLKSSLGRGRAGRAARPLVRVSASMPLEIEFWQDGAFRLHDRVRFTRASPRCCGAGSGSTPEACRSAMAHEIVTGRVWRTVGMTESTAEARAGRVAVHRRARQELLGIILRGYLLMIPTIGLYRFWQATWKRRFYWQNTVIDGEPLEYTGTRDAAAARLLVRAGVLPADLYRPVRALDAGRRLSC